MFHLIQLLKTLIEIANRTSEETIADRMEHTGLSASSVSLCSFVTFQRKNCDLAKYPRAVLLNTKTQLIGQMVKSNSELTSIALSIMSFQ